MTLQQFIRLFTTDPVNLSLKGKVLAVFSCLSVIFIVALLSKIATTDAAYPILVASMGASSVIVFIIPNSPVAQPWALVGGQIVSALAGISSALWIDDITIAATVAVGLSVFLMLLLRCLHPPGAATALAPVIGGHAITSLGYSYALQPVALNVLIMLGLAIIVNRYLMGYDYPALTKNKAQQQTTATESAHRVVSENDAARVLAESEVFLDVTAADLSKLLSAAEQYRFQRVRGDITCADIMLANPLSVEYGTEVEDAWQLMLKFNLKAVPVIDRARRVIGIVTWQDFFKYVDLNAYENLSTRLRAFIRRTPDTTTHKPEAVGHIMNANVIVLAADTHIIKLIPLMSSVGHRQVPIVDAEKRLVGMVTQADLIAALYQQQLVVDE